MTPREQLYCVEEGETPSPNADYDLIPVYARGTETIVGVLVRRDGSYQQEPLSEERLVSSGTSIRHLIQLFILSQPPHSLLVVDGGMIVGIVSRADLGKVASRAYLYTLFAELETLMARLIRSVLSGTEALSELSQSRQEAVLKLHQELKASDEETDFVSLMSLADLINIIVRREELYATLGYLSRSMAEDYLNGLVPIRNSVAHPVRELKVAQIVQAIQIVESLIERLEEVTLNAEV